MPHFYGEIMRYSCVISSTFYNILRAPNKNQPLTEVRGWHLFNYKIAAKRILLPSCSLYEATLSGLNL